VHTCHLGQLANSTTHCVSFATTQHGTQFGWLKTGCCATECGLRAPEARVTETFWEGMHAGCGAVHLCWVFDTGLQQMCPHRGLLGTQHARGYIQPVMGLFFMS
jgi:hypothetical protein